MRVEKDGGATVAFIADDVADKVAAHGIESGGGLIEENQVGSMNQGLGEANALHHALGEAAKTAVAMRSEADEIEIGGDTITKLG